MKPVHVPAPQPVVSFEVTLDGKPAVEAEGEARSNAEVFGALLQQLGLDEPATESLAMTGATKEAIRSGLLKAMRLGTSSPTTIER